VALLRLAGAGKKIILREDRLFRLQDGHFIGEAKKSQYSPRLKRGKKELWHPSIQFKPYEGSDGSG